MARVQRKSEQLLSSIQADSKSLGMSRRTVVRISERVGEVAVRTERAAHKELWQKMVGGVRSGKFMFCAAGGDHRGDETPQTCVAEDAQRNTIGGVAHVLQQQLGYTLMCVGTAEGAWAPLSECLALVS